MKFSVAADKRKSSIGTNITVRNLTSLILLVSSASVVSVTAQAVPLPLPRPAAADANPKVGQQSRQNVQTPSAPTEAARETAATAPVSPPAMSACRLELTADIAVAPSLPPIHGAGGCGGDDIVRLEAVVLRDKRQVPLKPAAVLRCGMARAIADWVRGDVDAIATQAGTRVSGLDNFNSYECRGRNRQAGAKLSEHGRANALDLRMINLANGTRIDLTEKTESVLMREKVKLSMCRNFMTVLGPGSDGYHEDHIHFDMAPRRNNYRICNWTIEDGIAATASLMPRPRPPEADVASAGQPVAEPPAPQGQQDVRGAGEQPPQGATTSIKPSPVVRTPPVQTARNQTGIAKPVRQGGRIVAPPPLQLVPVIPATRPKSKRGT